MTAFRKGLAAAGYLEGQNLAIEYSWAHNEADRLPELAAELVRRRVAVIAAPGAAAAALAAKAATRTIPIVFGAAADPVELGLVASFNRPGSNITGINSMAGQLDGKRFGLLRELVPAAERFAALVQPANKVLTDPILREVEAAATAAGSAIAIFYANSNAEIDAAFVTLAQKRFDALLVTPSSSLLFQERRVQIVTLAVRYGVPVIYPSRIYPQAGGLMSYGASQADQYRLVGTYVGRILKGDKPADLPVMRPTKFEFVLNLQTAKTQGFTIPPTLLVAADEVIE
jgi:putative ABC transport system substrate-binding protein